MSNFVSQLIMSPFLTLRNATDVSIQYVVTLGQM